MGKRGPKPTKLNWEEVEKLVSYQCTQDEVASFFNISQKTLERAIEAEYGEKLDDFWAKKKNTGRLKLRKLQLALVEKGGPGAATMAIWLDKKMNPNENPDRKEPAPLRAPEALALGKRTFTDFCTTAGYATPFAKQLEMRSFGIELQEPSLLLGSRGYGKTDYVTILGVAYQIYIDPDFTCLIVTKSKTRNGAILSEIATALEKNGVVLEKNNSLEIRRAGLVGKDSSASALTILSSSFRGRHPDLIVMDDPVTPEDTSEATRKRVKKCYDECMKLTQKILVIGQPVHAYDLFEHLRPLIRKMEVPYGSIPELDPDLEAMKLAGVDVASISASYYLKVLSEGSTPFDKIKFVDQFGPGDAVAFIDPSHEGGDYTALSIFKGYGQGMKIVGFVWKRAWFHCIEKSHEVLGLVERMAQYGVKRVCFETNALGDQAVVTLSQAFAKNGIGIGVVGRRSTNNKHSRIMAAGQFAEILHLSRESDREYVDQVVKYDYKASHDDAPDSLATGLEWIGLIRGKQ